MKIVVGEGAQCSGRFHHGDLHERRGRLGVVLAGVVGMLLATGLPAAQAQAEGVQPSAELNLVQNPGFEDGVTGWTFSAGTGVATNNPHTGARLAFLDPGDDKQVSQQVSIPETGSYTLAGWIATQRVGATLGLREAGGDVLASTPIPSNSTYSRYEIRAMPLEAGDEVELFVIGGTGWTNIDDFELMRDDRTLLAFDVPGQQGESSIDHDEHTVTFQMPYESDVTALVAQVELPGGATISPDPAEPRDYTSPVTFTVETVDGERTEWTATVVFEEPSVTIESSNAELEEVFNWAKWKARTYVQTGKRGPINVWPNAPSPGEADYVPSYWAGYAHRTAFYGRDYAHQTTGAHLLGLDEENKTMLKAFAASANEARKWYPLWALNFDASPYLLDYRGDTNFVREVPAVFELVQKADEQYRWTGDEDYLDDPALWQYYTKAVTDFIELHDDQIPNGVAEGTGRGIFQGAASYNERGDQVLIEAGDGLASQYRAFLAYANMARRGGDPQTGEVFAQKAEDLREHFNTEWGVERGVDEYIRGRDPDNRPVLGFGRESSLFMALKEILDPNAARTYEFIDYLDRMYDEDRPPNIEAISYVPDTMFLYGETEKAWDWMHHIIATRDEPHEVTSQGTNGDYPEVSYTLVSQTVEGLAGVRPNAPERQVATVPRLPEDIDWLELDHIPVGAHDVGVRHDGTTRTTLRHSAGPGPMEWTAQFYGGYAAVKVDRKVVRPEYTWLNGRAVSQVTVTVPVGEEVTVEVAGENRPSIHGDTILTHPEPFELAAPADGATGVATREATFRWKPSANADQYRLRIAEDEAMSDVVVDRAASGVSASVTGLRPGAQYYWDVTAVNTSTGQRLTAPDEPRTFRTQPSTVPAAPDGVHAYRVDDAVAVTWRESAQALRYSVYRAPAGSEEFALLTSSVTGTSFLDETAGEARFRYRVTGSNELGEGPPSVPAEEEPLEDQSNKAYLSDLDWESATIGWRSVGRDRAVSGNPIRINGTTYEKGLGTHAVSEIVYRLGPEDIFFRAVVGIDDAQRNSPNTSIDFQVFGDGELLFDSGLMRAQPYSPPQEVFVDVAGTDELLLRVGGAGDGINSDHADWADAHLVRLPTEVG